MRGEREFLAVTARSLSKSDSESLVPSRDPTPEKPWMLLDDEDSGSEVEIVENYVPQPRRCKTGSKAITRGPQSNPGSVLSAKRKVKDEPPTSQLPAAKRARSVSTVVSKGVLADPIEIESLSDSSDPPSSPIMPYFLSKSSSPSSSEHDSSSSEPEQGVYPGPWPSNYHTCDILDGFRRMDAKKMIAKFPSVEDRFVEVFEQGFRNATYYDARRRLKSMKQKDIDHSRAAMRTPRGLWSRLAKKYPLRKP